MPATTWRRSPATWTWKNSSMRSEKRMRNLTRSSSGRSVLGHQVEQPVVEVEVGELAGEVPRLRPPPPARSRRARSGIVAHTPTLASRPRGADGARPCGRSPVRARRRHGHNGTRWFTEESAGLMDTDRTIDVMVEIPRGSRNKYEYDHENHVFRLDRRLFSATFYPADYGFVPDTLAEDGDPLDALVLLDEPTFPGCMVESRPVGVFWMTDEKGPDAKIICVACGDPMWESVHNLDELPPAPHLRDRPLLRGLQGPRARTSGPRSADSTASRRRGRRSPGRSSGRGTRAERPCQAARRATAPDGRRTRSSPSRMAAAARWMARTRRGDGGHASGPPPAQQAT